MPAREPRILRRRVAEQKVLLKLPDRTRLTPRPVILGFLGLIALGTLLLFIPASTSGDSTTSIVDALFTSTSSVCVTGLVVVDTGTHWSLLGQVLILALIQIGGFGFMTGATLILIALRRSGLKEQVMLGDSLGEKIAGIDRLIKRMAIFTLTAEFFGAVIFFFRFSAHSPPAEAAFQSIFHSISAFNNAGFAIFGNFSSLSGFQNDPVVILTTAVLIILGGISFVFISDLFTSRRFARLSLDSKIVLLTTAGLLVLGTLVILLTEFSNDATLGALPVQSKIITAFFYSVSTRTAGFSTISVSSMAQYSLLFTVMLMFIGGAAASTAGGIKVNTLGLVVATTWSSIRGKLQATAFGREFFNSQILRVLALIILSVSLIAIILFLLSITENHSVLDLLFETVSAFGTVGLSTGITPSLTISGKILIVATMFVGRLGPLTIAVSLVQRQKQTSLRYPKESVRIG